MMDLKLAIYLPFLQFMNEGDFFATASGEDIALSRARLHKAKYFLYK